MKCTEMLIEEHDVILDRLNAMENWIKTKSENDVSVVRNFISFVKEYVDEYHHNKEEDFYFRWIIEKNPSFEKGPIACMLGEHNQGRDLIKAIEQCLQNHHFQKIDSLVLEFSQLLRNHISKENSVLYKAADQLDEESKDGDDLMLKEFKSINEKLKNTPRKFGIKSKEASGNCCGSCS